MFQPGNEFWKARSRHGVKPIFPATEEGSQKLLEACQDYFEWAAQNPLLEEKVFSYEGGIVTHDTPRIQAFTILGLCIYIDIATTTWRDWKREGSINYRPDLLPVITWAEDIIRQQKFTAAAAGLLNANIISRDLGLADKSEISGPGGGPIHTINEEMTPEEAADLYAQTREQGK